MAPSGMRISLTQATGGLLILAFALQRLAVLPASADQSGPESALDASIASGRPGIGRVVYRDALGATGRSGADGPQPPSATPLQLADTSLVVTGTIMVGDGSAGYAIMGNASTNTQLYSVGEKLPGSYRLVGVYRDHVVMERDGQHVSLGFATLTTGMSSMARVVGDSYGPAGLAASASIDDETALEVINHSELVTDRMPLIETAQVSRDHDE